MKKITVLGLKHAIGTSILGPFDIFRQAGRLWNYACGEEAEPFFDVQMVSPDGEPVKCLGNILIQPSDTVHNIDKTDLVIISSIADVDKTLSEYPKLIGWLKKQYGLGTHIASVCTGAFLLAETGLLEGKTATTHWGFVREFRKRYPEISLKPERLITDEKDLFCSGGLNSGIDLAIYLVGKYCGREASVKVSKAVIHDFVRTSQRPYSVLPFQQGHGDRDVLAVQKWLEAHYSEKINYDDLPARYGMSRRTLERRFKRATGDTPLLYLQRIRVENAKQLLESNHLTFDEVSYQVGYEDSGFFRKLFTRYTGLLPNEYSKRFRTI